MSILTVTYLSADKGPQGHQSEILQSKELFCMQLKTAGNETLLCQHQLPNWSSACKLHN